MQDTIIFGNGTSKQIKTASLPNSYAEFKAMAENGNIFADISLNADGCEVVGTPLNKLNLLTDETAEKVGNTSNPNDAFNYLGEKTSDLQNKIGDISGLLTKNKNDVVSAINELTADRKVIEERTTLFSGTATWDETRETYQYNSFKLAQTNLEEYDFIEIVFPPATPIKYYDSGISRYQDTTIYFTTNTIKIKVTTSMPTSSSTRWIYDNKTHSMSFLERGSDSTSSYPITYFKKNPFYVQSRKEKSSLVYYNDELTIYHECKNISTGTYVYPMKADIYGVKVRAVNE